MTNHTVTQKKNSPAAGQKSGVRNTNRGETSFARSPAAGGSGLQITSTSVHALTGSQSRFVVTLLVTVSFVSFVVACQNLTPSRIGSDTGYIMYPAKLRDINTLEFA